MGRDDGVRHEERRATCDECFFRRAALCAIRGNTPCPTFRAADDRRQAQRLTARPREVAPRKIATTA